MKNLFKTICYLSIFLLNGFELSAQMFNVKINSNLHTENFDGRLLLLFSNNNAAKEKMLLASSQWNIYKNEIAEAMEAAAK